MSLGERLGMIGVILSFFAIAAPYLWPDKKWIGWASLGCAVGLLITWGFLEFGSNVPRMRTEHPIISNFAVFIIGGSLALSLWLLVQPSPTSTGRTSKSIGSESSNPTDHPPNLAGLFKSDFSNAMKFTDASCKVVWRNGDESPFVCQLYWDFPAKTQFVGYYLPSSARTFDICMKLADGVRETISKARQRIKVMAGSGGERNDLKDLTFSGRVIIYHEDFLSIPQKAAIMKRYTAKGFDVNFRGPEYLGDQIVAWHHKHDARQPQ